MTTDTRSLPLPIWAREVIDLYESGASSQFILHGNISDVMLIPGTAERGHWGSPEDFIKRVLLTRFDVILTYDLGNGIRVDKGGDRFSEWPAFREKALPSAPREAIHLLTHYLRFCANVSRIHPEKTVRVAIVIRHASLVIPSSNRENVELNAMASQIRDWASDLQIVEQHCASFLLTENLNDLHYLVSENPQSSQLQIPLPNTDELFRALELLASQYPTALSHFSGNLAQPAQALVGSTLQSIETRLQILEHRSKVLQSSDLVQLKKELVESDARGLIEFLKPDRDFEALYGQEFLKNWLRQDISLWNKGDLQALPMGYLFCGPVGTGKTYLVECLAGEAAVPVIKLKNFRDKWVGSTESNLEKIFRILDALGRCIVFVDEADQLLGRRNSGAGDSGVSGRVYGMMAERMSDSSLRGKTLWVLATSRPDLVEVDLKRPGRIDIKIPLFPTTTLDEAYLLIRSLAKRKNLSLPERCPKELGEKIPDLLTPGGAEALVVKLYRLIRTSDLPPMDALLQILLNYQPPVDMAIIHQQIQLAVAEATDLSFVPDRFKQSLG